MTANAPTVLVVGTRGPGGILTVIQGIDSSELRDRWTLKFMPSHDIGSVALRLLLALRVAVELVLACIRGRVAVVHLHAAMRGSFWRKSLYMHLARWLGVPSVLHLHGSEMKPFYASQGSLGRWLIQRTLRTAGRVVVLSTSWRDFVLAVEPRASVEVVFNFVNVPAEAPPLARRPDGALRIAFLGLIGDRKGIFDLVKAVGLVAGRFPGQLHLKVGGNGEVDKLRELVASSGLANVVEVLGWIGPAQREGLLRSVHALALPSYNEGLPMALLEAMAYGLPVLTTNVGGIPELVDDGISGFLIQPGDVMAMQVRLEQWLHDDGARLAMGAAARQRVQRDFSVDQAVSKLHGIYSQLAGLEPRLGR